jgi:hypothetical protein
MTTPDDLPGRSSAEVMQALVHLRLGIIAVDRLLRRSEAYPGHVEMTMVLTEISQATHNALVRLTEAAQIGDQIVTEPETDRHDGATVRSGGATCC